MQDENHEQQTASPFIGINLANVEANDLQRQDIDNREFPDGTGGDAFDLSSVQSISSFQVYYDNVERKYAVHQPKVIGKDGATVAVTQPGSYSDGTYYCKISRNANTDAYSAQITNDSSASNDTVTIVPIFSLANGVVTQYHVGAIVLVRTSLTGQKGQGNSGTATKVLDDISIKGEEDSGLVVRSYRNDNQSLVTVDLNGRTESFGIHTLEQTDGPSVKIFSSGDMTIPPGGGGGGGTSSVDVITDCSIEINGNKLYLKFSRTKIKNVTTESVAGTLDAELALAHLDVVSDVAYTNPDFVQKKTTVYVLGEQGDPQQSTVFTTIPHSEVS